MSLLQDEKDMARRNRAAVMAAEPRKGARQRRRPVSGSDVRKIVSAIDYLKIARDMLRDAGAHHAATYVARAIKSADGAARHAEGVLARQEIRS